MVSILPPLFPLPISAESPVKVDSGGKASRRLCSRDGNSSALSTRCLINDLHFCSTHTRARVHTHTHTGLMSAVTQRWWWIRVSPAVVCLCWLPLLLQYCTPGWITGDVMTTLATASPYFPCEHTHTHTHNSVPGGGWWQRHQLPMYVNREGARRVLQLGDRSHVPQRGNKV